MENNRINFIFRSLSLLICLCSYGISWADDPTDYLLVWDRNGGSISFPLSERPNITFDAEQSKVNCVTHKQEISFSLQEVYKYTLEVHEDNATGVEELPIEKGQLFREKNSILFMDFAPGSLVKVFAVNGILVHSGQIDGRGELSIPTTGWSNGVYVINAGNSTFKIIKK